MATLATPLIGAQTERRTTEQEHSLGTVALGNDGKFWVYCKASGAVSTGARTFTIATGILTNTAGTHTVVTAFADGEYGWVHKATSPVA